MSGSILAGLALDATAADIVLALNRIERNLGYNNNGAMAVTLGAAIVPVSQSGTWTVQPGNTANTTAWLVTAPATGLPTGGYGSGLDQHYASQQAYGVLRDRITVT